MFTCNTQAFGIYSWTGRVYYLIVVYYLLGLFDWLVPLRGEKHDNNLYTCSHCRYTNYYRAFRLHRVLFSTKQYRSTEQVLAADPDSLYILMVVSQQTSRQSLHAFHVPLPCSILPPGMLNQASSGSESLCLSCCAGRLLITTTMNNITSPTIVTITAIELHVQELVGGVKDWINTMSNTDIRQVFTMF